VAVYTFSHSFVFPTLVSIVSTLSTLGPVQISIIMAALLILVGSLQIIVRREPRIGFFIFLVVISLIPSLLATTTTDWAQILGLEFEAEAELPWGIVLLFTTLTILGYVVLRFTAKHNSLALAAADRGFNRKEVGAAYINKHIWGLLIIVGAMVIVLLVFLVSNQIERALSGSLRGMPMGILLIGIICSLILIIVAYAFLVRGRVPFGMHLTATTNGSRFSTIIEQQDQPVEIPAGLSQEPGHWVCPYCGSSSTQQYRRSTLVSVKEGKTQNYEWESRCNSCGGTWVRNDSDIEEGIEQLLKEEQVGSQSQLADLTSQQQKGEIPTLKYAPGKCPYCESESVSQRIKEGPLNRREKETRGYYYRWDCQCFDCGRRWWGIE